MTGDGGTKKRGAVPGLASGVCTVEVGLIVLLIALSLLAGVILALWMER